MKLPFSNSGCRLPIADCPANSQIPIFNRKSQIANHKFQRGVALIITLILLAVVTVMAVAFLANSRRERGSVTTSTDTAGARLAADAALAQAESQIMANVLATTNPYNFGLVVSTNYINLNGFNPNAGANPTNVNYYDSSGNFLTGNNFLQNVANLLYSPRAPVFVPTNPPDNYSPNNSYDFRYYLDLNRNGTNDPNGLLPTISPNGEFYDTNGNLITTIEPGDTMSNFDVGDPEWIGVLDHPDQPHGPNNRFIARYAFVAVPIGNALDLNAIYNQAATRQVNSTNSTVQDGFMRNQGVGSWEINLAAFLADLNTNQWDPVAGPNPGFFYNEALPTPSPNQGYAFEDALSLLSYRYDYNYDSLFSADSLFALAPTVFPFDNIDGYSDGPLQTTLANINESIPANQDIPSLSWAGSDNTKYFFDLQELFNPNESSFDLTNRLLNAGNGVSTYDRYTFYRLMSQMGVDSAPEQDKMNLNYDNLDASGNVIPGAETNFISWTAEQNVNMNGALVSGALKFFTFAADRMLRAYSQDWLTRDPADYVATYFVTNAFGITDIPVLVSNQFVYSSAIQRVLQLAANMYDATTNTFFPSVFRPTFNVVPLGNNYTNVYVNGYEQVFSVIGPSDTQLNLPIDVTALASGASVDNYADGVNVYGVPWIIGAKKGFPNFNEFSMEETVGVTRRLQLTRTTNSVGMPTLTGTNQMYTMAITNSLGVECWNSYASNYLDSVQIVVRDNFSGVLTNDDGMNPVPFNYDINNTVNPVDWPGILPWNNAVSGMPNTNSFDIPLFSINPMTLNNNYAANTNWWAYRFEDGPPPDFVPIPPAPNLFETNIVGFPFPHFGLLTTNRLQVFMLDGSNVIDYVQFGGPNTSLDIYTNLFTDSAIGDGNTGVWNTNLSTTGVPDGVANQIQISGGESILNYNEDGTWNPDPEAVPLGGTIPQQQAYFNGFFMPRGIGTAPSLGDVLGATATNTDLSVEAPYEPTRYVVLYTTWQANDPLVHYVASDLNYTGESSGGLQPGTHTFNYGQTNSIPILPNLGMLNDHYTPWGGNPVTLAEQSRISSDPNAYNIAVKDPLISYSDNWGFPTNKFPTVGWLGRVHRGTPWQTVDLKSTLPLITSSVPGASTWTNWTGDLSPFDADNSSPSADWQLFDLFTTAFNDNATRGQLSVNVGAPNGPSLAAWSALFSGVVVVTNTVGGYTVIQPAGAAGASSPLEALVANINQTRSTFTNADGLVGSFEHVGDILDTPDLTVSNQWLLQNNNTNTINDEMYEWLPQQTLSLLRVSGTPQSPMRYVIYCYGQTLKPAPNGIVTSGAEFGLCTNYQVVAEADTRAVVQFGSTHADNVVETNINDFTILTNLTSVTNNNAVIKNFNVLPPD